MQVQLCIYMYICTIQNFTYMHALNSYIHVYNIQIYIYINISVICFVRSKHTYVDTHIYMILKDVNHGCIFTVHTLW